MTIAVSVKVHDGLVLAADSATTFATADLGVINVYNNANKVFNLHKRLPIGAMTWGQGNIGTASIATLMKDLRRRFQGEVPEHGPTLHADRYTMKDVVEMITDFVHEEHIASHPLSGELGLLVGGYSSGGTLAEEYQITFAPDADPVISPLHEGETTGVSWYGNPEPINRILKGYSLGLGNALVNLGVSAEEAPLALGAIEEQLSIPFTLPAMPFQDAIDLAIWLVDLTAKFVRFTPGADTVGGPIEVAGITRHEGFKWIRRKHYFPSELNPTTEL
ncbi:hypothetical protein AB0D08_32795 [Kitasatospora sp. NPDC048540]|uniref:hypothetical protein n=1 Tax=Kitasatospora sp. NPDC048540 TaxID=3155634 RepID=UPI0033C26D29